jgi:hypothetical protein
MPKEIGDAREQQAFRREAIAGFRGRPRKIGIGVGLAASPSHITVRTGPYTAVRRIERTPVPAGGVSAGAWKRASARMLRSLQCRAVGLHLSALACRDGQYRLSAAWHLRETRIYSPLPTVRAFAGSPPLLTPALWSGRLTTTSVPNRNATQISRGKTDRLRRTPARFTTPALDGCGLRDHRLARPAG